MEYKIELNQSKLVLGVNKLYDKSVINLDKWEYFLDVLCGNRFYQKEAIRTACIYLASGRYNRLEDLIKESFSSNSEIKKKYTRIEDYFNDLQFHDRLFANLDLATGTGKSYVMFGISQILLYEGFVKRVLILCPSLTIEKGLTDKFNELVSNINIRDAIPEDLNFKSIRIINAESTVIDGDICIENIHAVYDYTGSSIKDSFLNKGENTLVLNDESHHIFNKTNERNLKRWKEFLINEQFNFKYILGFTGTAYIENEYFNDVIYRYSLRSAINDGVVKSIEYVQKDDIGSNINYKFQKIHENHLNLKKQFIKVKPITILITKDISNAVNLREDLIDFLVDYEKISKIDVEKKVLIVTSNEKHKANIQYLDYVDNKNNAIEWIVSVSMLTEGWDVKNVFQIVPWEDRAFNSKLLISQVLGRGLRLPSEYSSPQPSVIVFNHDSWSKNIKSIVNEVLEIETKLISSVKFDGERNKYNFVIRNLSYEKEEKEVVNTSSTPEFNYETVWNEGIKLKSQILSSSKETEYENLSTGVKRNAIYNLKLRTRTVDEVINKIYYEFSLRDWESNILGLGNDGIVYSKNNLPPKVKIEEIINKSMNKVGIEGNILIEENANKIFTAFSTLFRPKSKTVINSIKSNNYVLINTREMNDETRSVLALRNDTSLFYTSNYNVEVINTEQLEIIEKVIDDINLVRKSVNIVNEYDFKTPSNIVFSTGDPEYVFLSKYLLKHENAKEISAWIKSRDKGFYSIEYSFKIGSHTKIAHFNPDFILKQEKENFTNYYIIEIKDNSDVSSENKGKNKAAKEHFSNLNVKLQNDGINEKYFFSFLSPEDYDIFFSYLREDKLEYFKSGLETQLEDFSE